MMAKHLLIQQFSWYYFIIVRNVNISLVVSLVSYWKCLDEWNQGGSYFVWLEILYERYNNIDRYSFLACTF